MVYVSHHGDDRGTCDEVGLVVYLVLVGNGLDDLGTDEVRLEAKLLSDHIDRLCVQTHIDRYHQANAHTRSDDLSDGYVHHVGEVTDGHELGELQCPALCLATLLCVEGCRAGGITLVTAVLSGLGSLLVLAREAGESLLDLTLDILVGDYGLLWEFLLSLSLASRLLCFARALA